MAEMTYLEAISDVAVILPGRWRSGMDEVDRVLLALQGLLLAGGHTLVPRLEPFEFHSSLPVIGGLVASIRSLWYGVAARWAIRHLAQQQDVVNQQQDAYIRSMVTLARQVARLSLEAKRERESTTGEARDHE